LLIFELKWTSQVSDFQNNNSKIILRLAILSKVTTLAVFSTQLSQLNFLNIYDKKKKNQIKCHNAFWSILLVFVGFASKWRSRHGITFLGQTFLWDKPFFRTSFQTFFTFYCSLVDESWMKVGLGFRVRPFTSTFFFKSHKVVWPCVWHDSYIITQKQKIVI
jgi:hypothetical protein